MSGCCDGPKKEVLFYACSGGANVGEVADRAARELMGAGEGMMWCLAGIGADIEMMVEKAKAADRNIVLDGCPMDCAKRLLERAGVGGCLQVRVTDLGIEKTKGVRATDEQVERVVARVREVMAQ